MFDWVYMGYKNQTRIWNRHYVVHSKPSSTICFSHACAIRSRRTRIRQHRRNIRTRSRTRTLDSSSRSATTNSSSSCPCHSSSTSTAPYARTSSISSNRRSRAVSRVSTHRLSTLYRRLPTQTNVPTRKPSKSRFLIVLLFIRTLLNLLLITY